MKNSQKPKENQFLNNNQKTRLEDSSVSPKLTKTIQNCKNALLLQGCAFVNESLQPAQLDFIVYDLFALIGP